jgi:hypothetical protein
MGNPSMGFGRLKGKFERLKQSKGLIKKASNIQKRE